MGTYLITGGAGFYGTVLKKELLKDGNRCISIDLEPDYYQNKNYTAIQGDIRNKDILDEICGKYKFDAIFNFQDIEEDLPFKDEFAAKVKDLVQSEEVLAKLINNLYDNKDSIMPLHNCLATADFLSAYIKTDPGLDKLKTEYQKKLENLNGQYHSA